MLRGRGLAAGPLSVSAEPHAVVAGGDESAAVLASPAAGNRTCCCSVISPLEIPGTPQPMRCRRTPAPGVARVTVPLESFDDVRCPHQALQGKNDVRMLRLLLRTVPRQSGVVRRLFPGRRRRLAPPPGGSTSPNYSRALDPPLIRGCGASTSDRAVACCRQEVFRWGACTNFRTGQSCAHGTRSNPSSSYHFVRQSPEWSKLRGWLEVRGCLSMRGGRRLGSSSSQPSRL